MHDLNESTAIVTGGARGIGLSLARALAENGARVRLVDILQDVESAATDLTRHTGKESLGIQADVRDPDAIDAAFSTITDELGVPDILITSAGIDVRS